MYESRRLHPVAALINFIKQLKDLLFPLLVFFFFSKNNIDGMYNLIYIVSIIAIILFVLITGILFWYRYTYRIEDGELRIEYGVFIHKKRYIPIERIQSISVSAGIIQRAFKLVKLQVETAGGGLEAEVVLTAITEEEAKQLKELLSTSSKNSNAGKEEFSQTNQPVFRLSTKELLIVASTSSGIGVVFSAVFALLAQIEELIPYERLFQRWEVFIEPGFYVYVLLGSAIFIFAWLIGILLTVFKYAGFTVVQNGNDLQISKGILEKKQLSIPLSRIQAIRVSESFLRQPFGYATVFVESAGGTGDEGEEFSTVLFPIIRRNQISSLLQTFTKEFHLKDMYKCPPKRSLKRYIIRGILPFIPVTFALSIFLFPVGLLSSTLLLLFGALGYLRYRDAGWEIFHDQLTLRYRIFNRNTVLMKRNRIQVIEKRLSFFQQRAHLASIQASVKSSITGKNFKVVDLNEHDSSDIFDWYTYTKRKN
ncbi:PH domain-containing protein [Bacillus timonensis]|nr:PH domain-containing protein [Bacillus timonensis]